MNAQLVEPGDSESDELTGEKWVGKVRQIQKTENLKGILMQLIAE